MVMDKYMSMICKTSQHHLQNRGKIRKFLDQSSAETLVHSFVTSKIDHCNVLLFGLPKYLISRLQLVLKYCLKNDKECIIRFKNSRQLLHLMDTLLLVF